MTSQDLFLIVFTLLKAPRPRNEIRKLNSTKNCRTVKSSYSHFGTCATEGLRLQLQSEHNVMMLHYGYRNVCQWRREQQKSWLSPNFSHCSILFQTPLPKSPIISERYPTTTIKMNVNRIPGWTKRNTAKHAVKATVTTRRKCRGLDTLFCFPRPRYKLRKSRQARYV
jgi:hypothetical protein